MWSTIGGSDNVIAAHRHHYDQNTSYPIMAGSTFESQLYHIYEHHPREYSYQQRGRPLKTEQMEEKEEDTEEVKGDMPTEHIPKPAQVNVPACKGEDFVRFLERVADVYDRVA